MEQSEGGVGVKRRSTQANLYVDGIEKVSVELADKTILLGRLFVLLEPTRIFFWNYRDY